MRTIVTTLSSWDRDMKCDVMENGGASTLSKLLITEVIIIDLRTQYDHVARH